jgi:L-lactate dehydrogenase complex protein LldE
MQVALFYTCLVDAMRPSVGLATIDLLEAAGCTVVVPEAQTCCGQPAWNSGDAPIAVRLAKQVIETFEAYDYIVVPSGSCADQIRNVFPQVLADGDAWRARADKMAPRVYELTQFLVAVARPAGFAGRFAGRVTYHDSCTGLRALGIREQPRALLRTLPGLEIVEADNAADCCGFGGSFAIKFGEISAAIAQKKCEGACATGAQAIVGGDVGCLLNIEGKLRRMGDESTQVLHVAEVLAGAERVRREAG